MMSRISLLAAFCAPALPTRGHRTRCRHAWTCSASRGDEDFSVSRRVFLTALAGWAVQIGFRNRAEVLAQDSDAAKGKAPMTGFITRSGLKYIDFEVGEGPTPQWGDLVNISYVAYTISPSGDSLVKHDSSESYGRDGYLIHHGNGEQIFGLEEAIHSMSAGGRRRAIIPGNIAYSGANLGPVPPSDRKRRKFAEALQESNGTVVFDIRINRIWKDPMDRGYYNDLTPTPEEMLEIMNSDDPQWTA